MNINAQELMLVRRNMKFGETKPNDQTIPTTEPTTTTPEAGMKALELQANNNIAFQGVNTTILGKIRQLPKVAYMALALAATAPMMTSCIENTAISIVDPEALVAALKKAITEPITKNQEKTNLLIMKLIELTEKGNYISQENNQLLLEVISYLNKLDQNDQEGRDILNAILTKLEASIKNGEKMDAATYALLEKIAANQDKYGAENKKLLLTLIEKADQLDVTIKTGVCMVVDKMDKMNADQQAMFTKILELLAENNKISADNNQLISAVLKQLAQLDKNDKSGLELLNKIYTKIEQSVQEQRDLDGKTHALLKAILENVNKFSEENKQNIMLLIESVKNLDASVANAFAKLFNKMDNIGNDGQKLLNEILNQVINGNTINAKNGEILASILEAMSNIDTNNNPEVLDMLKNIWITLQEQIKQDQAMDEKTHSLLQAILANVQNFNKETTILLKELIQRADKFGPEVVELLNAIIKNQGQLSEAGKDATNKILEAINNNTEVAKGTNVLVAEILANLHKLGDKADSIIEAIAEIGTGENVDLSKIEAMLADLLAQEKANGEVLKSADAKASLILVTLEGIKNAVINGNKALADKIQEVIDNMPENCQCDVELKIIIELLQNILNGNDESIKDLEDLENMFK